MKINSEKGFTLIELLATLTISFLILSSIYGIITSVNKNYTGLIGKNSLKQEANIMISTIKKYYIENPVFLFKINGNTAYIGIDDSEPPIPITNERITTIEFIACTEEITEINKNKCVVKNNEEKIFYTRDPLYLHITLSDKNGQTYDIDTMINKY